MPDVLHYVGIDRASMVRLNNVCISRKEEGENIYFCCIPETNKIILRHGFCIKIDEPAIEALTQANFAGNTPEKAE